MAALRPNANWGPVLEGEAPNAPCQRSLHTACVWRHLFLVFGGYDGASRVNDFHGFNFLSREWSPLECAGEKPSPRDRHVGVVYNNRFFVFGGFDGSARVNDFFECDLEALHWARVHVAPSSADPPSPRHSHAAVVHGTSMYVFGGYDGSYRSDFQRFDFATAAWRAVGYSGQAPRARYRATCVVHGDTMLCFGGHDGTRHLSDVHVFDFTAQVPAPRDSHVCVVHRDQMVIFGGSTGQARSDLLALDLESFVWSDIAGISETPISARFCHAAAMYREQLVVFGGYDGAKRLNDFQALALSGSSSVPEVPASTLLADLRQFVDSELFSDITFVVEGRPVHAHKLICVRCEFFKAMLMGEMLESRAQEIDILEVRHPVFLSLLEYLYTDTVEVSLDNAMELFQAADKFGVDRLKAMCELEMWSSIDVDTAASIFLAADVHHAQGLRQLCLDFILANFAAVTKTPAFEDMGRTNMDLVFEVLQRHN